MRKLKMILWLMFICGFGISAWAQGQHFEPAKNELALRDKLIAASQKIQTIACAFTQEKSMNMLADKAISKGRFYFKKEGRIRLEYLQPVQNLIIMNQGAILMQSGGKTTRMDMHRSRVFQQLNQIISGSVNGSLFTNKDFKSVFSENKTAVEATLTPVSKTLRNFISNIVIVFDKQDFTAMRIEMNEASGDNTVLLFSDKKINEPLADSLFQVK